MTRLIAPSLDPLQRSPYLRLCVRSRAERNASGMSRRDASTNSYKNARSPKANIGRICSNKAKRYSSSSGTFRVASSSPAATYRPRPLRFRSPSRTRRVKAKVMVDRLVSGIAVTISLAETGRPAARTYSYTRCIAALVSRIRSGELPSVNDIVLTNGNSASSCPELL